MTNVQQQPLHGAALYNPHLLGRDELVSLFVARRDLLELLLEDLRATDSGNTPQHHLILGQRGMGKTMLLRRLAVAVEEDPTLGKGWIALTFPEEQYNVVRLSDFWLNCTDALSDVLEIQGRHAEAEELDESTESLRRLDEDRRAREALNLLVRTAKRIDRRLVLLVDNVDLVFERIKEQEWSLREVLSSEPGIVLIGASANAVESSFQYDRAFYDFFRVHELEGLSLEETKRLLIHFAEVWGPAEVKQLAEREPSRIKILHSLTGGNPRTITLLFNVLASGADGDVRTDLERLLDQCTPLYKARFEALPMQAQQVIHAMAVHWNPVSAGELAQAMGLEVNAVSTQLNRLVRQGVVEKVPYDPETKTGFQIAERFFNIWYLMRASRRVRRRLLWLVEFLRIFYSQEQLRARALLHIQSGLNLDSSQRLRHAEYSFALADAVADPAWRSSLERIGLTTLLRDDALRCRLAELVDLETSEPDLKQRVEQQRRFEDARFRVVSANLELEEWSGEDFWSKLKDSLLFSLDQKIRIAEDLTNSQGDNIPVFMEALAAEPNILESIYCCQETISALAEAVRTGLMTDPWDVDGAAHAESVLGSRELRPVALANRLEVRASPKLLRKLWAVLEQAGSPFPWMVWLRCCLKLERGIGTARINRIIRRVRTLPKGRTDVLLELGVLLRELGRYTEAEAVAREALALDAENAFAWLGLGDVLVVRRPGEPQPTEQELRSAEEAYRRAVQLGPEISYGWNNLGLVLKRLGKVEEAEESFREALRQDATSEPPLMNLAQLLMKTGRLDEAEQVYGKAIDLAPDSNGPKLGLAWVSLRQGNFESAKKVVAEVSDPRWSEGLLSVMLALDGNWSAAAVLMRKFISSILEQDLEGLWPETLIVFRVAVGVGKAREALTLLEETGAAERWQPLREALEAAARGSDSYLRRVAPEVRQSAREILEKLLEPLPQCKSDAKQPTKARRKRRPPESQLQVE